MLLLSLLAAPLAQTAIAEVPPPVRDPKPLFLSLEGRWSCAGAFANGKPLQADLRFERSLDGRTLRYTHIDRPPNAYLQESSWGIDKETGQLVSIAFTAFRSKPGAGAALYVAENWSPNSVTFVHQKLLKDPWAPNRFTYTVTAGALKMVWEVQRKEGDWRMGDYIDCQRKTVRS